MSLAAGSMASSRSACMSAAVNGSTALATWWHGESDTGICRPRGTVNAGSAFLTAWTRSWALAVLISLINVAVQYSDWVGSKLYVGYYQRHIAPLIGWSIGLTAAGLLIVPFLPTARLPDQEDRPPKRGFEVVQ